MAARRTGGLGRGLDALIPAKKTAEKPAADQNIKSEKKAPEPPKPVQEKEKAGELEIKISAIEPNRSQSL